MAAKKKKAVHPLSDRAKNFPREFIIDLDKGKAAVRSGYAEKTSHAAGTRLYKDPRIKKLIKAEIAKQAKRTNIEADKVLKEIALSGFSNIQNLFDDQGHLKNIRSLPPEVAASIASIEVVTKTIPFSDPVEVEYIHKIKMVSKENSLRDLGKHLKLFTEKVEHSGSMIIRMNNKALRPEDEFE